MCVCVCVCEGKEGLIKQMKGGRSHNIPKVALKKPTRPHTAMVSSSSSPLPQTGVHTPATQICIIPMRGLALVLVESYSRPSPLLH